MGERLKKYYPFTGKKSPYVIHPDLTSSSSRLLNPSNLKPSTMADKEYIRYTSADWDRNRVDSFTNSKLLRLLLLLCVVMTVTVLVRQCLWSDRSTASIPGGVEHIQIILVGGGGDGKSDKQAPDSEERASEENGKADHGGGKVKKCKPGETKMKDCNSCKCVEDGSGFACTKMFCGQSKAPVKLNLGNGNTLDQ